MATRYCNKGGNDGNGGTDPDTDAWLTIDYSLGELAAGDHLYIGPGTYTEECALDATGTATTPVIIEGYKTTPGDGWSQSFADLPVIDGNGKTTGCLVIGLGSTYYVFRHLTCTDSSGHGFDMGNTDFYVFEHCRAYDNTSAGFYGDQTCVAVACSSYSNGSHGYFFDGSASAVFACLGYSNGAYGVYHDQGAALTANSLIYDNESGGVYNDNYVCWTINNTLDGDDATRTATEGIRHDADGRFSIVANCCIYDFLTGIVDTTSDVGALAPCVFNLVNSNATADYSANSQGTTFGEQTAAPAFADEAGDDYTPGSSSPLRENGVDARWLLKGTSYWNIGGLELVEPAGGAGGPGVILGG